MYLDHYLVAKQNKLNRTALSAIARKVRCKPVADLAVLDFTNTIKQNRFRISPTGMIINWQYIAIWGIVSVIGLCSWMASDVEFGKKLPALEFLTKVLLTLVASSPEIFNTLPVHDVPMQNSVLVCCVMTFQFQFWQLETKFTSLISRKSYTMNGKLILKNGTSHRLLLLKSSWYNYLTNVWYNYETC